MNAAIRDELNANCAEGDAAISRRHVIYVSGYDPRGAPGYFDLFRRTCDRFQKSWPFTPTLRPLSVDSEEFAHWDVELRGANWRVATRYDFLRTEAFIRSDMERPALLQMLRALGWFFGDVFTGAEWRIFRASWRFALHLLYFQLLAIAWLAATAAAALMLGYACAHYLGAPAFVSIVAALAGAFVALLALRPLARRWRVVQIGSCWATLRRFARGRETWLDRVIESGARRVLAAAEADDIDELAIVGHSTGGVIASAIVARALELSPDLGRRGPRLVLLTLGSVMPAAALHAAARRMRAIVSGVATAPTLAWVDCQSRKDVMCFANFDPVGGIGLDVGSGRRNPLIRRISFKETIAPEDYNRFRWNHFRVHYQYIMAGDRPAPYDYLLLVAGPRPIAEWPRRDREFLTAFLREEASGDARRAPVTIGTAP